MEAAPTSPPVEKKRLVHPKKRKWEGSSDLEGDTTPPRIVHAREEERSASKVSPPVKPLPSVRLRFASEPSFVVAPPLVSLVLPPAVQCTPSEMFRQSAETEKRTKEEARRLEEKKAEEERKKKKAAQEEEKEKKEFEKKRRGSEFTFTDFVEAAMKKKEEEEKEGKRKCEGGAEEMGSAESTANVILRAREMKSEAYSDLNNETLYLIKKCEKSMCQLKEGKENSYTRKEKERMRRKIVERHAVSGGKILKMDVESLSCMNESHCRLLGHVVSECSTVEKVNLFLGKDGINEEESDVFFACMNVLIPILMEKENGKVVHIFCHELERAKLYYILSVCIHLSSMEKVKADSLLVTSWPYMARRRAKPGFESTTSSFRGKDFPKIILREKMKSEGLLLSLANEGYELKKNSLLLLDKKKYTSPGEKEVSSLFLQDTLFGFKQPA